MKNTLFKNGNSLAHFICIDFENEIFSQDMGFVNLTEECLERLLWVARSILKKAGTLLLYRQRHLSHVTSQ